MIEIFFPFSMKGIYILFDGSNLITKRNAKSVKFAYKKELKTIQNYCSKLIKKFKNINPIVFVDSTLRYIIDEKEWLEQQIKTWQIFESKKGHEADEYLICFLKVLPLRVFIVSNDIFRDHRNKIPQFYNNIKWRYNGLIINEKLIVPNLEEKLKSLPFLKKSTDFSIEQDVYQQIIEMAEVP